MLNITIIFSLLQLKHYYLCVVPESISIDEYMQDMRDTRMVDSTTTAFLPGRALKAISHSIENIAMHTDTGYNGNGALGKG